MFLLEPGVSYLSLGLSSLEPILTNETVGLRKSQSFGLQQILQTSLLRLTDKERATLNQ